MENYQQQKLRLKYLTKGLGTARYNSIQFVDEERILFPAGPTLFLLNLQTGEKEKIIAANSSAIFSLISNKRYIYSVGFGGDITIFEREKLEQVDSFQLDGEEIRHCSCTDEYVSITTECKRQIHQVYRSQSLREPYMRVEGKDFTFGEVVGEKLYVFSHIKSDKTRSNKLHVLDLETRKGLLELDLPHVSEIMQVQSQQHLLAVLYDSRNLLIYDTRIDKIVYFGKVEGKGTIFIMTFDRNLNLYLVPKNGFMLVLHLGEGSDYSKIADNLNIETLEDTELHSIIKYRSNSIQQNNLSLAFSPLDKFAVVFNELGLSVVDLKAKKEIKFYSNGSITYCGLCVNHDETLFATGDFLGNIVVHDTTLPKNFSPYKEIFTYQALRCLEWSPYSASIIFSGHMGGAVQMIDLESQEVKEIFKVQATVTSIKFNKFHQIMLVSCTIGTVFLLKVNPDTHSVTKVAEYQCHQKQKDFQIQFGSLHIKAEIWNTVWHKNEEILQFATCSEDQSVKIFEYLGKNEFRELHTLTGHTLASTCVDWQDMHSSIGEVFVSCSDDKTIRLYNPQDNFRLTKVLNTFFIEEWFTLTYLALQKGGTKLAVASQVGYLFIYDLLTNEWVHKEKVHLGGIEGLVWKKNKLVTISSDCLMHIIEF